MQKTTRVIQRKMKIVPQPHGGELHIPEKGETANPWGRPRKLISQVLHEMKAAGIKQVKANDIVEAYESLLNLDEEDIVKVVNDKKLPYFMRLVASAMTRKGQGFEIIERMVDRAHGKAKETMEVSGNAFLDLMKVATAKTDVKPEDMIAEDIKVKKTK